MNNAWIVARHEYLINLRRRSFLIAAFGVPLFSIALMIVVFAVAFGNENDAAALGPVGYVDQSGVLAQAVDQPDGFAAFASDEAARQALDDKQIGAYFVVPADYMATGAIRLVTQSSAPEALKDEIDHFLVANLGARLDRPEIVTRLENPLNATVHTLDNNRELKDTALAGVFLSPLLLVFVVMFALQISSGYLMSGVSEEKTNRIMEMLITSVSPLELLFGKIVGLGALGLTQLLVWVAAGAAVIRLGRGLDVLAAISLPPDLLIVGLVYFLLAYLLFGSLMASVGIVIGSEQESKQYAGILSIALALPFFFITQFINDPNGPIPLALTLIPLTAPTTIIMRMAFAQVPAWQLAASIAILAATSALVVLAAGRIFRWSLLLYGKRPSPRELFGVIRGKPLILSGNPRAEQS